MRARTALFAAVGAILAGFGTSVYALSLDPDGWEGFTMRELAIGGVVVGVVAGAILGLVVARLTLPSVRRRTRLVALGALTGLLAGFLYGLALEEVCVPYDFDLTACGRSAFLAWEIPIAATLALWTLIGAIIGTAAGATADRLTRSA